MYVTTKRFRFWTGNTVKNSNLGACQKKKKKEEINVELNSLISFPGSEEYQKWPKVLLRQRCIFSPSYFLIPPSSSSPLTEPREAEEKSIYHECDLQTETWCKWLISVLALLEFPFNIFYDPFDSFHYLIIHNMKRNNLLIHPTQRDTTAFWSLSLSLFFLIKRSHLTGLHLAINRKLAFLYFPQYIIMIYPTVHHFLKSQRTLSPRELIISASVLKYEPTLISN